MPVKQCKNLKPGDMFEVLCFDGGRNHDYCYVMCVSIVPIELPDAWPKLGWLQLVFLSSHQKLDVRNVHERGWINVMEEAA